MIHTCIYIYMYVYMCKQQTKLAITQVYMGYKNDLIYQPGFKLEFDQGLCGFKPPPPPPTTTTTTVQQLMSSLIIILTNKYHYRMYSTTKSQTHMLHAWTVTIYLHVDHFGGQCWQICHTWSIAEMWHSPNAENVPWLQGYALRCILYIYINVAHVIL